MSVIPKGYGTVVSVSLGFCAEDGSITHLGWLPVKSEDAEQIRALLGEPVCETLLPAAAVTAVEKAGDAAGGLVL